MKEYWDIKRGVVDSKSFFKLVSKYFYGATTVFVEGTSIATDVLDCYKSHSEKGKYLPGIQTILPKSTCRRCVFTIELMEELTELSLKHAEWELLDHFYLYKGDQAILEWPDAFGHSIFLSGCLPEETVASFSKELNLEYSKENFG